MMAGFLDRVRAERLMAECNLDALLLIQPESVTYASGALPGIAAFWRRAGAAMVLVPADAREPLAAIVGDLQAPEFRAASQIEDVRTHPIWVDVADLRGVELEKVPITKALGGRAEPRPTTFDRERAIAQLRDVLAKRHLLHAAIGAEHAFLPQADAGAFAAALPSVRWSDASELVARLRMIKAPQEQEYLRLGGLAAEAGVQALAQVIRLGMGPEEMTGIWREAALAEAKALGAPEPVQTWAYMSVGSDGFAPGGPAEAGDLIKVDVGCVVRGYSSDSARTFVLGEPSRAAAEVYSALQAAFVSGERELKPGVPLSRIHQVVIECMHAAGFTAYARGHFGHGVGASVWSEEWPFIGADSDVLIETGMVLAFETPWYIRGLGALMIEDQFSIGGDGARPLWSLPRDLVRVPLG
jgi:Xaa-Pro aminopeptidase